jgi:aspartyl-tRNA(Asn)/glutamyl-tRNA(Gln) amidotransferase subunit B
MGWNDAAGQTFLQREKEEAHDYRYFPDPDLMPVEVSDEWISDLKSQIGELPAARRARYVESFGLAPADAAILADERTTGDLFEQAISAGASPKRACNLVVNVLATLANERSVRISELNLDGSRLSAVASLMDNNLIAASSALPLLRELTISNEGPQAIAQRLGLLQSSDTSAIDAAIDALLSENPKPLQDYRAGKQAAMGALVGMVMKSVKGLNPKMVQDRLRAKLDSL